MENESKRKKSEEALAELYRNTNLAMQSIEDILPEVDHEGMTKELHAQHEGYSKICAKVAKIAKDKGIALKEPGVFKKAMMWSSIKMSAMMDGSRNHIAEMMIRGTVMGITALRTTKTDLPIDPDPEIEGVLSELIAMEEDYEKRLKEFL
jgi:hypothetical protein